MHKIHLRAKVDGKAPLPKPPHNELFDVSFHFSVFFFSLFLLFFIYVLLSLLNLQVAEWLCAILQAEMTNAVELTHSRPAPAACQQDGPEDGECRQCQ